MIIEQFGCIPFGGDICPEQWDEATWQEDIRLMRSSASYGDNQRT